MFMRFKKEGKVCRFIVWVLRTLTPLGVLAETAARSMSPVARWHRQCSACEEVRHLQPQTLYNLYRRSA